MIILEIIVLIVCVRLLIYTNKPFLCAGVYVAFTALSALLLGAALLELVVGAVIALVFFSLYFWLLDYYEESVGKWYLVLILGFLLSFFMQAFVTAVVRSLLGANEELSSLLNIY